MVQRPPRILMCGLSYPADDEISGFAEQVAGLLHGRVDGVFPQEEDTAECENMRCLDNDGDCDLVIWGEPEQSGVQQLLARSAPDMAVKSITRSLLVIRRPRWPLRQLLLIARGEETDDAAADWLVRLARPIGAAITVLAVVPPMATMAERFGRTHQGLDALLTTGTDLGQRLRRLTHWLVEWGLEGTLRLRQGTPEAQIRREIYEGDYDLVAVGSGVDSQAQGWLEGDCIRSVLRWSDRPLLVAKPSGAPGLLTSRSTEQAAFGSHTEVLSSERAACEPRTSDDDGRNST